jgi:hypothetical protein
VLKREKTLAAFVAADLARAEADFKAKDEAISNEYFLKMREIQGVPIILNKYKKHTYEVYATPYEIFVNKGALRAALRDQKNNDVCPLYH